MVAGEGFTFDFGFMSQGQRIPVTQGDNFRIYNVLRLPSFTRISSRRAKFRASEAERIVATPRCWPQLKSKDFTEYIVMTSTSC